MDKPQYFKRILPGRIYSSLSFIRVCFASLGGFVILAMISCSKSSVAPVPDVPKTITVHIHYEAQTNIDSITLNGTKIADFIAISELRKITISSFGTVKVYVKGGGGGDQISIGNSSFVIPLMPSTDQMFQSDIQASSYIIISK